MGLSRTLILTLVLILPSAGAEGRRPHRTLLYPTSIRLAGSSIAVAPDGSPHILYPSPDDWLRHAWREDGQWRDEPVESEISTCAAQSIAVDSLGRPHIAYTARFLVYAVRRDYGWEHVDVAPTISDGAIAFRPGDRPALLHDAPDLNLELLYLEGGVWTVQDTGLSGFVHHSPDLAFDANGVGHLLFYRDLTLYHATDASGTWMETALSEAPYLRAALALDPQGNPHVVVSNASTGAYDGLFHHWNEGSGWTSEEILREDGSSPPGYASRVHADEQGHLIVSYTDAEYFGSRLISSPRFAYHDGVRWRQGYTRVLPEYVVDSSAIGRRGELHLTCGGSRVLLMSFALPDLATQWNALTTSLAGGGLRAESALRVRNLGAGKSAPTRIRYFLSDDDRLDEGDEPVGRTRRVDAIRPGREREIAVSILLPSDAAGRHLLAVVDPDERRDDLDRPNNTASFLVAE